jgi:hypothetical protein
MTATIKSITNVTRIAKILLSNFRCIKIRRTNDDLMAAIMRASATVSEPR